MSYASWKLEFDREHREITNHQSALFLDGGNLRCGWIYQAWMPVSIPNNIKYWLFLNIYQIYFVFYFRDKSERKIILLSDFNEEEDVVNQFQVNDIAKTLSLEEISLIAMYVHWINFLDFVANNY